MELESNLANAYLTAYKNACEKLNSKDFQEISLNTNALYDKDSNRLILKYLNDEYGVDCSNGNIKLLEKEAEEVTTTVKVLILHYLLNAKAAPLTGRYISFKEIPGGGAIYYQTFYKRAVIPLMKTFHNDYESFYNAADKLGGCRESLGNASITIKVFPLMPVTYVLWKGDDEFQPSGTILFDSSITSYLPGEDIVLAASFGVYELMKHKGRLQ